MGKKENAMLNSIIRKYYDDKLGFQQHLKKYMEPYVAACVEELRRKMVTMRYYEMMQRNK